MGWTSLEGMGYNYYSPAEQKNRFYEVDSLEDPESCYSFDDWGVLKGPDGRFWYGRTSGCSCPGKWHEHEYDDETFDTSLAALNKETFFEFERETSEYCSTMGIPIDEKKAFLDNVRRTVLGENT